MPVVHVEPLIEVAGDDTGGGNSVKHREDTNADHQLLQFIGVLAFCFHDLSDVKESHKSGQEERSADDQITREGDEYKARQSFDVHAAHIADPRQLIPCHLPHHQDHDGFHGWDGPCRQVEVAAVGFYGLVTPLLPCSQEPCKRQDNPPEGTSHAKIIQNEEHNCTAGAFQAFLDNVLYPIVSVARYALGPHKQSNEVAYGINAVGHRQKDDWSLWVFKPLWVNKKSEHSEGTGDEAEDRPDGYPHKRELLVSLAPIHVHSGVTFRSTGFTFLHKVKLGWICARLLPTTVLQLQVLPTKRPLRPEIRRLGLGHFGGFIRAIIWRFHAEVVGDVLGRQSGAVQRFGPGEVKLLQDRGAFKLDLLAHNPTCWNGVGYLLCAHGSIQ